MRFALRVLDDMLAGVLKWTSENPDLVVVFASSMGQEAIHRGPHGGVELVVEDLPLLMSHTGISRGDYVPLLAMVPQVAVAVRDNGKRERVRRSLEGAICGDGKHFINVQEIGGSLSITVRTLALEDISGDTFRLNGMEVAWRDAGIHKQDIEPGTGYHIREGSLAVFCEKMRGDPLNQLRSKINADRIKDCLLAISREGHSAIPSLASACS